MAQKKWESVTLTRPTFEAFALPCRQNEQRRKPPKCMYLLHRIPKSMPIGRWYVNKYYERHLLLLDSLTTESCEVSNVKNKRL